MTYKIETGKIAIDGIYYPVAYVQDITFWFRSRLCRDAFVASYKAPHTMRFWFRLYKRNPFLHFVNLKPSRYDIVTC